ncbi:MAG: 50S ribosomal protein L1 [Phycisphaerales bacterium]|nr:50S ribosomal protein L1 [Phycisphaerae bacterium]NNF43278.1 50S ribosomal protein L1 [Phycisphaerales bacterium]NNM26651.1 50S ribosomal protein L1 [Phycisphaerales bacterium]
MGVTKRTNANTQIAEQYSGPQTPEAAIKAVKTFKGPKFDQSVEACVHLGIDPRQADQQLRGSISMPNGVGKTARVICFCGEDKIDDAKGAGAVEAGGADLIEKVSEGWFDFDVAVASPDMMREVSKLGRVLGPKGLMPSPKAGTVAADVVTAVKEYAAGKLEYRNDAGGNIHCVIGKMSFSESDLLENFNFLLGIIEKIRPAAAKGTYIKKVVVSGTMTPGVQVAV